MANENEKAIKSVYNGDWDSVLNQIKNSEYPEDFIDLIPSAAIQSHGSMPNEVINDIVDHLHENDQHDVKHKFIDSLSDYFHENDGVESNTLEKLAHHAMDYKDQDPAKTSIIAEELMTKIKTHPNWSPSEKYRNLSKVGDFWWTYENNSDTSHLAAIKSMTTGEPEEVVDHSKRKGHSDEWSHVIPHLNTWAKEAQDKIMNDESIPKKDIDGEPHIRLHRGVNGLYGKEIQEAAGYNHDTNKAKDIDFKIPKFPVSSWTVDKDVAANFAHGDPVDSVNDDLDQIEEGHKDHGGTIISSWFPVKNVLHSGHHNIHPSKDQQYADEKEVVIHHPESEMKVHSSDLSFINHKDIEIEPDFKYDMQGKSRPNEKGPFTVSEDTPYRFYSPTIDRDMNKSEIQMDEIMLDLDLEEILNKSKKNWLATFGVAAGMLATPNMAETKQQINDTNGNVIHEHKEIQPHPGLEAIGMVESSGGKNIKHRTMEGGMHANTRAIGTYGIMPVTTKTILNRDPKLKSKYPDLHQMDPKEQHDEMHDKILSHPTLETELANSHWKHLMNRFDGDSNRAAHAWFNGPVATSRATDDEVNNHFYVQRYNKYKNMMDAEEKVEKSLNDDESVDFSKIEMFSPVFNTQEHNEVAYKINELIETGQIHDLSNVGKFTHNSFVVGKDPDDSWLIKVEETNRPGIVSAKYGLQVSSEAAFYHVVDEVFGMGEYIPESILGKVNIEDEEHPAVAIKMLSHEHITGLEMEKQKEGWFYNLIWRSFQNNGVIHRLASLLYILGDGDSHGQNVMSDGKDLKIIDHGTGFAGHGFNPSEDEHIFIPYFMRVGRFKMHDSDIEKMENMPTIKFDEEKESLRYWLLSLDENKLKEILDKYAIDSSPVIERLIKMKDGISVAHNPDKFINLIWIKGLGKMGGSDETNQK